MQGPLKSLAENKGCVFVVIATNEETPESYKIPVCKTASGRSVKVIEAGVRLIMYITPHDILRNVKIG